MDNTYIESMRSHIALLESDLNGLSDILATRPLSKYEYRAAERTLQIVIEACIGLSKHWCKKLDGVAPASAYHSFIQLSDHGIAQINDTPWKQIIGMRNALVHDYLNIDREVIESLVKTKRYESLVHFSSLALAALE